MVEAQDSEFEPRLDHSVVLLGKTLYAHSAFLGGNRGKGDYPRWFGISSRASS